jgi:sporulation protein YlmC with PRC-barrel domain
MNNLTEDNLSGANHGPILVNTPLRFLTASSVIGDKVRNEKDENLGVIKDIMLDITTGKIDYYVIEFGGFLGIGAKYFAIPFRLLRVDPEKKDFVFKQRKEVLEKAPGFDPEHWPDTNIHLDQADNYWSFMG